MRIATRSAIAASSAGGCPMAIPGATVSPSAMAETAFAAVVTFAS
jgi:hypothetical protein